MSWHITPWSLTLVIGIMLTVVLLWALIRRWLLDRAQHETERQLRDIVVIEDESPEPPMGGQ